MSDSGEEPPRVVVVERRERRQRKRLRSTKSDPSRNLIPLILVPPRATAVPRRKHATTNYRLETALPSLDDTGEELEAAMSADDDAGEPEAAAPAVEPAEAEEDEAAAPADESGELTAEEEDEMLRVLGARVPARPSSDVIVLDDTLTPQQPTPDECIVDLTADDEVIMTNEAGGSASAGARRNKRRAPPPVDDDVPLVAVSTAHRSKDTDVIVIEKENQRQLPGGEYDTLTPKRKMLSCPICFDHERGIRRSGRQMMSTTCGHIFCNECITQAITSMKRCPTCRKKLTKKTGMHPIFV